MNRSAHQAALDQAKLLASYLSETPTSALDLHFIRRHLETLESFVQAAQPETAVVRWIPASGESREADDSEGQLFTFRN